MKCPSIKSNDWNRKKEIFKNRMGGNREGVRTVPNDDRPDPD